MTVNAEKVEQAYLLLLEAIGERPDREGLRDTPKRAARFWQEFIEYDPGNLETAFEAVCANQLVVLRGIRVHSLCEHHLLPIICDISLGYLAREKVVGLSKLARIAHLCAHKLQLQERLVFEIADSLQYLSDSPDVAVIAKGLHLCMAMRGIKASGVMITSDLRGAFLHDPRLRAEFLELAAPQGSITLG